MTSELPSLPGVEHRYLDLPGLRMHIAEAGQGSPVVLLHGVPQNWWEWRDVLPVLAQQYRVIVPDLRGAGWTEAPRTGYDGATLLDDLLALLDALGLDRVRLVAHDWSAILGFELCLSHPDRVQAYASLSIPHPYFRLDHRMLGRMRIAWYQLPLALPGVGVRGVSRGRQWLARHMLRYTVQPDGMPPDELEFYLKPLRDPAHARAVALIYSRYIRRTGLRMLAGGYRDTHLTTPTLLLTGAQDPVVRPDILGGHEGHADDLEIREIAGASHFMVDDQPEAIAKHLLEFFARH
ncbi:MAG: alpha/beta fold hydrolase [Hamadaea sp.]|uniref:alpha/beta fold hydrolase n=1 Tax=Hamadaea sp. TaxID=2024425 RepID=UPI0018256A9A|nr:alpha/beta fold hydrolase [Hamadaea sp.]NUT18063.1 alpha/beta fold hydrolase [Hamadaea sp.]